MKILFVIYSLRSGGAEKVLTMLANHMATLNFDVTIVTFSKEKPFYKLNDNINLLQIDHKITKKGLLQKVHFLFSKIRLQTKIFKEINPDVIISFITLTNNFSIIAAKLAKIPIIVSEHTNYKRFYKKPSGIIRRLIYPFANEVVILTSYDKQYYKKFIENLHVIKNPLILENIYCNINRENIILAVGTLYDVKGFDMLIEAYSKIKNKHWKVKIVGEGKDREKLQSEIDKKELTDNIELVGLQKDVEKFYKQASIFVLSSRAEGFPGALCESLGYGCASIAFDCISGPNEIIKNNRNGILVEANNTNKLASTIDNLINNKKQREYLSKNACKITDELSIENISNQWINILTKYKRLDSDK
jgi:GalNAc-alpha-(1->4)-GalNAc-alpha-(1->3)-diNAcBac-PP-undecaprenol alpha-1,4-N-acetyl-D-galactosaminyltransferase